jgi:hypothetical protein
MQNGKLLLRQYAIGLASMVLVLLPVHVFAHCDGMDGPVVKAAQMALANGDVNRVLIWVQPKDEPEISKAFQQTLAVRKLSPEAKDLADRSFFETLVRIHRAGEGAPYTGLKPAGRDLGPAIPAADKALERGSEAALRKLLLDAVEEGLHRHFDEALSKKNFKTGDVQAGRNYVKAYVELLHYSEGLYRAAKDNPHGHAEETE